MSSDRFVDDGRWVGSFLNEVLVHCPQCDRCATIRESPARLICRHCGYVKEEVRWNSLGPNTSDESISLWLQRPCCGETLWAFNSSHLLWLESYVAAHLRERKHQNLEDKPDENWCRNSSLASRLPRWMTSAKNREEVLRNVEKLKQQLPQS